jgi:hypothetical protein
MAEELPSTWIQKGPKDMLFGQPYTFNDIRIDEN